MNAVLFAQEITELQTVVNQQKQLMTLLANFDKCAAKLVEMKKKLAAASPQMWERASAKLGELLNAHPVEAEVIESVASEVIVAKVETIVADEEIIVAEEPVEIEEEKFSAPYQELFFSERVSAFALYEDAKSIHCGYLGFNNKKLAERWGNELCSREIIKSFEVRKAERVTACKYEIKVRGITVQRLEALAKNKNIFNSEPTERLLTGINLIAPVVIPVPTLMVEVEKPVPPSVFLSTPAATATPSATKKVVNEKPRVGDWVELLADGTRYQVEDIDKVWVTISSGSDTKRVYCNELKVVMSHPLIA